MERSFTLTWTDDYNLAICRYYWKIRKFILAPLYVRGRTFFNGNVCAAPADLFRDIVALRAAAGPAWLAGADDAGAVPGQARRRLQRQEAALR